MIPTSAGEPGAGLREQQRDRDRTGRGDQKPAAPLHVFGGAAQQRAGSQAGLALAQELVQQQPQRTDQPQAGIGGVRVAVDEGAGQAAVVKLLLLPHHHVQFVSVYAQAVERIDEARDGDAVVHLTRSGGRAAKLERQPEHPAIGHQAQDDEPAFLRIQADGAVDVLAQERGRLGPIGVMPRGRREGRGLDRQPRQHAREQHQRQPDMPRAHRRGTAADQALEAPDHQQRGDAGGQARGGPGPDRGERDRGQQHQDGQGPE